MAYYSTLEQAKKTGLKNELVEKLKLLENEIGTVVYNSAYRSAEYNKQIGGAKQSQHVKGLAVDILRSSYSENPDEIIKIATSLGFTGIGVYDNWVHLDVRENPNARGFSYWDERKNIKTKITLPQKKKIVCQHCQQATTLWV